MEYAKLGNREMPMLNVIIITGKTDKTQADIIELAKLYKTVYESWQKAFELKKTADMSSAKNRGAVSELLKKAYECENAALQIMAESI